MIKARLVKNRLPELRLRMAKVGGEIANQAAEDVVTEAKSRAPVRSGFLRDSIKTVKVNQYRTDAIVGAFYGYLVELGTVYMAAQPFWIPALEIVRLKLERKAAEALRQALRMAA